MTHSQSLRPGHFIRHGAIRARIVRKDRFGRALVALGNGARFWLPLRECVRVGGQGPHSIGA